MKEAVVFGLPFRDIMNSNPDRLLRIVENAFASAKDTVNQYLFKTVYDKTSFLNVLAALYNSPSNWKSSEAISPSGSTFCLNATWKKRAPELVEQHRKNIANIQSLLDTMLPVGVEI
mgnify:CR=1 FL=1